MLPREPGQTVAMSEPDAREPVASSPAGWGPETGSSTVSEVAADFNPPMLHADPLVARPATVLQSGPADTPEVEGEPVQRDWAWVEEWHEGGEPTPWGPGAVLAAFAASIVAIAIYVITAGLIDRPILAIVANIVIAGGLTPALYMARTLPVLRWVSLGGALGAVLAWIAVLFFPVIV